MASSACVREDHSLLSTLDRGLYRVESVLALVGGFAVLCLMFLAVFSVGGRGAFNQPLRGYVDWIEQVMPLIAFVGIAYTQRFGGHIRMDIVVARLKGRPLWAAECLTTALMLVLMILMAWGSWAHFSRSFDWSAPLWSRDSSLDIRLPLWPAKLVAPVAFMILCLRLTLQLWGYTRAFCQNAHTPVAVPLIQDAASIAAREAESVAEQKDPSQKKQRIKRKWSRSKSD